MEQLRVIMMVPSFPRQRDQIKGGVHSAILNLLLGFEKQDISVRLISLDPSLAKTEMIRWSDNIDVYYEKMPRMPVKMLSYLFYGSSILKKHIEEFDPVIIHYQIGGTFLLTRLFTQKRIPYLLTIHGISLQEAKVASSLKTKITLYWNGNLTRIIHPEYIINISNYSKNLVPFSRNTAHPVIYNAISRVFFNIPLKTAMTNRLLYVGVINERKNLQVLLKAMLKLREKGFKYTLTVVGGADSSSEYLQQVNEYAAGSLKGQVELAGWRSQAEIPAFLENTDIVVLPSKQETLPMSVAEAMAAGKMVIASNVGGLPEMIESDKNGFLFDPSNEEELVALLEKLYSNNETLHRIGKGARQSAEEKFDNSRIATQTISYYNSIRNNHS
jgi:glycosyltransferase involved in cell wall biosynthesis